MNSYGNFGQAGREDGHVTVCFPPGSFNFPPVPLELQPFISKSEWDRRLAAITQLARRYSKPLFERIWIFLGFLLMFVTPIIAYRVLVNNRLYHRNFSGSEFQQLSEIRLITFGIFVAVVVEIMAPYFIWKGIGRHRMQTLIKEWSKVDILAKNKGLYVPLWSVAIPSAYSNSTTVRITIPPRSNPTVFHPDAYLPPYIAPPEYMSGYTGYNQVKGTDAFQDVKI